MAVRFPRVMGLLDDAIREHLELKRSRGADPEEVAAAEREALEPLDVGAPADAGDASGPAGAEEEIAPAVHAADEQPVAELPLADFSSVGQETAELDMQAVLAEDAEHAEAAAEPPPAELPGQERLTFE
jgi:hypothetical protein